jgi:hypothetical protein
MSKFVVTIDLSKVRTNGDREAILRELADDLHAGDHDIFYKGDWVGDYKVIHP